MSKAKTNNMYILTWNIGYNNNHVTQKDVQMYFQRLGPRHIPKPCADMHIPRHGHGTGGSTNPKRAMKPVGCRNHSSKRSSRIPGY